MTSFLAFPQMWQRKGDSIDGIWQEIVDLDVIKFKEETSGVIQGMEKDIQSLFTK